MQNLDLALNGARAFYLLFSARKMQEWIKCEATFWEPMGGGREPQGEEGRYADCGVGKLNIISRYQPWCFAPMDDNDRLCLAKGSGAGSALFCNACDRRFPEAVFLHPLFILLRGGAGDRVRAGGLRLLFCKSRDQTD
jgi:hypothetical protein